MQEIYEQLKGYIIAKQDEMITLLEKLVMIESGPTQPEGVDRMIDVFQEEFDCLGLTTHIIHNPSAGNIIVANYCPEGVEHMEPVVLSGHMDTVFQDGVTQYHGFKRIDEYFAKGAGIADMKGGLVIALYTLKALVHLGYQKHPIKMLFVGDEETLHRYSDTRNSMLEELSGAAMMLNFEPAEQVSYLGVSRKGGGMIRMEVEGIGAHSGSGAAIGRSAIVELASKVIALEARTDIQRGKLINVGLIQGGVSTNTIPAKALANIAVRFPTGEIKEEILADLTELVSTSYIQDTHVSYEVEAVLDAMECTPSVNTLADHFIAVGAEYGYGELVKHQSNGASDAALGVIAGLPTLCSMGIVGQHVHTLDEVADLRSLVSKTILAAMGVLTYKG